MPNDVSNVAVGKPKVGGAVFIAPVGTELPTDASTQLNAAFECFGYISDEGVTVAEERSNESITAWGGDTVATRQTSYTETFSFTPIEINPVVAKAHYGDDNVEVSSGKMTVKHNASEMPEKVIVIETVPNEKTVDRFVVPRAKLTSRGELTLADASPMGRAGTYTALPDEDGNTAYEYMTISGLAPAAG